MRIPIAIFVILLDGCALQHGKRAVMSASLPQATIVHGDSTNRAIAEAYDWW